MEKPFNFPLQSQVIIELDSGHIIEGIIDFYNENFIKLRNCTDHNTGAPLHSQRVYRTTIRNILTLEDIEEANAVSQHSDQTITSSTCCTKDELENPSKRILLPKEEYLRLKELTKTFVYMAIIDSRYYDAVDVLKNCETIGMSGFINGVQELSVLVLSSWDKVYVFDIMELNQDGIPKELQEILEMPSVQKVTHHGKHLVICLQQFYKVHVKNIFDTQVADFKIRMQAEKDVKQFSIRKINEMLSNYLNFPDNIIHKDEKAIDWKYRPLDPDYRLYAAESVTYVITLKNTLERILLKDYYDSVSKYVYKNVDDLTTINLSALLSRSTLNREEI